MRRKKLLLRTGLIYAGLILVLLVFIGPILWFVLLAIRPSETVFAIPPVIFFTPSPAAFQATFVDPGANRHQLVNSLIVAGGAVLLNLPFSFPAAYALSRFRMRGRKNMMLWYLGLLMAPPVAFLIPYFVLVSRIGLRGTYLAMILIMQTITIPFSVWLMKSFIDEVPVELEEAARVDGAKWHRVIARITLPLVQARNDRDLDVCLRLLLEQRRLPSRSQQPEDRDPPHWHAWLFRHRRRHLDLHRRRGDGGHAAADDHLSRARPLCGAGAHLRFTQGMTMMTKAPLPFLGFPQSRSRGRG